MGKTPLKIGFLTNVCPIRVFCWGVTILDLSSGRQWQAIFDDRRLAIPLGIRGDRFEAKSEDLHDGMGWSEEDTQRRPKSK